MYEVYRYSCLIFSMTFLQNARIHKIVKNTVSNNDYIIPY